MCRFLSVRDAEYMLIGNFPASYLVLKRKGGPLVANSFACGPPFLFWLPLLK